MDMQYIIAMLVCITAAASFINYRYIKLPKSIGLTILTLGLSLLIMLLIGIGQIWMNPIKAFLSGVNFSSTVMDGMLSYLLFAGALHVNVMQLSEHRKSIAAMATVSVVICCVLVAYGLWFVAGKLGLHMPLLICLLFGALIAPTDPVCVINAMRRTNTPNDIRMKIMGESLFNDAAGIFLFVVILQAAVGHSFHAQYGKMATLMLQQGFGGIILGYLLGAFTSWFLKRANNDETAILLTLALVTGGYAVATAIDVSGPLCMVIAGLVIGNRCRKPHFSNSTVTKLYNFWNLIDDILNSFLFVMIGLEILSIATTIIDLLLGVILFVLIIMIRGISIGIPAIATEPLKRFNWRALTVMTWGGMRGGVPIALALSIPTSVGYGRDIIISTTYVVVIISIVFQGLSLQPMLNKLFPHKEAVNTDFPDPQEDGNH